LNSLDAPEMPKPDADLWRRGANVIVFTNYGGICKREMVSDNQNPVANRHLMSEAQ
jgi:hypothetical protein